MVLSTSFMAIPPTFSGYWGIGEGGSKSFMRVKGVKVLLHELRAAIHAETKEKNTAIFSTMLLPCPSLCSRKNADVLSNLQHI